MVFRISNHYFVQVDSCHLRWLINKDGTVDRRNECVHLEQYKMIINLQIVAIHSREGWENEKIFLKFLFGQSF